MKTDIEIQRNVTEELEWRPFIREGQIIVSVNDGIVTLNGEVESYAKKILAEQAVKKVGGVRAMVENIHVNIPSEDMHRDNILAAAVLNALKWNSLVPDKDITIHVENGMVKLEGEVDWDFQRNEAAKAIQHMAGIKAVFNAITLKHRMSGKEIKQKISSAFHRIATIDAGNIEVNVVGSKVTLLGQVGSISEKEEAENTAWLAPGITFVDNRLEVGHLVPAS